MNMAIQLKKPVYNPRVDPDRPSRHVLSVTGIISTMSMKIGFLHNIFQVLNKTTTIHIHNSCVYVVIENLPSRDL